MFKAELATGDFSKNTMTFEIKGKMSLKAGEYMILTKEEYEYLSDRAKRYNEGLTPEDFADDTRNDHL
jgi:hypothetical protein